MPTTLAGLLQLLLSYFVMTAVHKQKCFTLQDFLARILKSSLFPAQRRGVSTRRINAGAQKKRSDTPFALTKWVFQKLKLMKTHLTTLHIALINKMFPTGIFKAEHNNMKRE